MSLVGFRAKNHPQQATRDDVDDRRTPRALFDRLHLEHRFTIDAAASQDNAMLSPFWTREDDALRQSWGRKRVWCNPPYSDIEPWVKKAWHEMRYQGCDLVVMLLPANRCEQCSKIKFAAAAMDDLGAILALGCNHNPRPSEGWSCATDCVGGIRKGVRSGTCVERCFSVHAEQDALLNAAGCGAVHEIAVAGVLPDGSLFDNGGGFYCTVCARIMAAAGVEYVTIWTGVQPKRLTIQQAWDDSYRLATA